MSKILPRSSDVSAPYWKGCKLGELRLQQCTACQNIQFYPRIMCSGCHQQSLVWITASGRGVIASFTVVRRGVSEHYPTPYIVALIDLEEGPRMMSLIVDVDVETETVAVGKPVKVAFEAWSDEIAMPVFHMVGGDQA